jgi:signal transduction histidine kinase
MLSRIRGIPVNSLRTTLILFSVAPMLLVIIGLGWYGLRTLEHTIDTRLREDIQLIARALEAPASDALARAGPDRVTQILASALRFDRVYAAYVYDSAGKLVAASGPRLALLGDSQAAQLAARERQRDAFEELSGTEVYSYFVPLTDPGERIHGLLQITRRGSEFRGAANEVRMQALVALGLTALALVVAVMFGHHYTIGRHVQRIGQSLRQVANGEHAHRVAVSGPHELRNLSAGVNEMLDGLERSAAEVAKRRADEQALRERLRHSEKMAAIGTLAAGIAHELGTPLAVVDGTAQRALRKSAMSEETAAGMRRIREEALRMRATVGGLLEFGRPHRARRQPESLRKIAVAAVAHVADDVERGGARIECRGPDPAPVLPVDRLRLEQALGNLLRNALHASRDGRVAVSWYGDGESAGFCVDDDGPGITSQARERLFEPFFTTKPIGQGTGLGLAVAHSAISEHGGSIEVEESPLGGARFRVRLPVETRSQ